MNKLQRLIYNEGERLVPYVSHNEAELVRHRSSYAFFHRVITCDLVSHPLSCEPVSVIDLGFGSGYGCAILSSLPNSQIIGVDIGAECKTFAEQYYPRNNVKYIIDDLAHFIPNMQVCDYTVSRGVLEHVPDGLTLIKDIKANRRVMIDVPYDEVPGNEHHVLTGIKESHFKHLENCEIFYEDLEGAIYTATQRPSKANMIMVVISSPGLPKVSSLFDFPIKPVKESALENMGSTIGAHYYYDSPLELLCATEKAIKETDVVLDIGCGIRPMNYFRPKIHFLVEPFKEYVDILKYRHADDKSVMILQQGALEALTMLADNSVDSIFLLDVIEHIEKEQGKKIVEQCERVAREQIVLFTPLGFMPQHIEKDGIDAWGLSGGSFQKHLSGWLPEDFSAQWNFYICKSFHHHEANGTPLEVPFGAFFAIRNFEKKSIASPHKLVDIRIPLFSAYDSQRLHCENNQLNSENNLLKIKVDNLEVAYQQLLNSRGMRLIKAVKWFLNSCGIKKLAQG